MDNGTPTTMGATAPYKVSRLGRRNHGPYFSASNDVQLEKITAYMWQFLFTSYSAFILVIITRARELTLATPAAVMQTLLVRVKLSYYK